MLHGLPSASLLFRRHMRMSIMPALHKQDFHGISKLHRVDDFAIFILNIDPVFKIQPPGSDIVCDAIASREPRCTRNGFFGH
jgi:hypothetical protein